MCHYTCSYLTKYCIRSTLPLYVFCIIYTAASQILNFIYLPSQILYDYFQNIAIFIYYLPRYCIICHSAYPNILVVYVWWCMAAIFSLAFSISQVISVVIYHVYVLCRIHYQTHNDVGTVEHIYSVVEPQDMHTYMFYGEMSLSRA